MAPASITIHDSVKLLIVSLLATGDIRIAEDRERFARFVGVARQAGFNARHEFVRTISDFNRLLSDFHPDLVFCSPHSLPLMEENSPESSTIPVINLHAALETVHIPYVGSDPETIARVLDKAALKERWKSAGVATPDFVRFKAGENDLSLDDCRFPAFPCLVKPSREGNSKGISDSSIVHDRAELACKIRQELEVFGDILAEHYLGFAPDFCEYTVAMIGSPGRMLVMPAQLGFRIPKYPPLITSEDKDGHRTRATPVDNPETLKAVADFASQAFKAAGVRDYARCDLVFANGRFQAIEINGQPMIPDRWFEACARSAGLDEPAYLSAIILAALVRHAEEENVRLVPPPGMAVLIPEPVYSSILG